MSIALLVNLISKLIIILVCFDTGRKEGRIMRKSWFLLSALWAVVTIIKVIYPDTFPIYGSCIYLVIGVLTIRVSETLRHMHIWSKLIEWSGAGLIGATLTYIVFVI